MQDIFASVAVVPLKCISFGKTHFRKVIPPALLRIVGDVPLTDQEIFFATASDLLDQEKRGQFVVTWLLEAIYDRFVSAAGVVVQHEAAYFSPLRKKMICYQNGLPLSKTYSYHFNTMYTDLK